MTNDELESQIKLLQLESSRYRKVLEDIRALYDLPVVKTIGFSVKQLEGIKALLDDVLEAQDRSGERD